MAKQSSVVTPDRFAQGLTYRDYLAQIKVNLDRFQQYNESYKPKSEDLSSFQQMAKLSEGPAKVLALAEDWCPDVFRGLPVMAKLAEASGMELRVFPRDQNQDIMDGFLKDGQFQSIPVFVFYTQKGECICHWIERPALANRERGEIDTQVKEEMGNAPEEQVRAEIRSRASARYPAWQQEMVSELRELLLQHTNK